MVFVSFSFRFRFPCRLKTQSTDGSPVTTAHDHYSYESALKALACCGGL